jgi:hypothetical protein
MRAVLSLAFIISVLAVGSCNKESADPELTVEQEQQVVDEIRQSGRVPQVARDIQTQRTIQLVLMGNGITDGTMENVRKLRYLRTLALFATNVTDAGLEQLKALNHLEELQLADTKVTDQGVKKLQETLPNCRIERPH